jgi:hypothetical protein
MVVFVSYDEEWRAESTPVVCVRWFLVVFVRLTQDYFVVTTPVWEEHQYSIKANTHL